MKKSLLNVVLSAKNFYDNVVGVQFAMGNASFSIKKLELFFRVGLMFWLAVLNCFTVLFVFVSTLHRCVKRLFKPLEQL